MDVFAAHEFWSTVRLIVVFGFILGVVWFVRGGRRADRQRAEGEARMIQEMYQGMERMEKRVEHLESILMDRDGKGS